MKTEKKISWFFIFIIPIAAFIVSTFAVLHYLDERGYIIRVEFHSAEGIESGKTPVKYHGVPVGKVEEIELTDDLKKVVLVVRLNKKAYMVASRGARFKIVRPKATIGELENLEAIVSGDYIDVELPAEAVAVKPEEHVFYYYFIGDDGIEDAMPTLNDLFIKLKANDAFSATDLGSKIFYKGYPVGIIEDLNLTADGNNIYFLARIYEDYAYLVRNNSVFWNMKVLDFEWRITKGFMIKTVSNPIQTAINGGVAFATPSHAGSRAHQEKVFKLNESYEEEWLSWKPSLKN